MGSSDNLSHAATIIRVSDIHKSVDFYTNKLGFSLEFQYGEPIYYSILKRGGITIHLTKSNPQTGPVLYVFVHDVDKLYQEFFEKGIKEMSIPEDQEYGMRDFDVTDLDGNQITFGTGIS